MADKKDTPEFYEFEGGEVTVWYDNCICLKAVSRAPYRDPVDMGSDSARALAETILRLLKENE